MLRDFEIGSVKSDIELGCLFCLSFTGVVMKADLAIWEQEQDSRKGGSDPDPDTKHQDPCSIKIKISAVGQ